MQGHGWMGEVNRGGLSPMLEKKCRGIKGGWMYDTVRVVLYSDCTPNEVAAPASSNCELECGTGDAESSNQSREVQGAKYNALMIGRSQNTADFS